MADRDSRPEALTRLVAGVVADTGLYLEQVTVARAGRRTLVRVTVDLPETEAGSVDLDRVAEASRAVSEALDAAEPFGQSPYVLEVSSPGVDRPLTERRHWRRARGRLVRVSIDGAAPVVARVLAVDEDGVTLAATEVAAAPPVAWNSLGTGRIQVEFSRPDDDTADENEEG